MVKADPFSGLRYVGGIWAILGIGGAVWVAIIRWGDFGSMTLLFVMALLGAALVWSVFPWAKVEKLRQSAGHQEDTAVPLATEQPVPDETALALPCTIKLRPTWRIPLICFALSTVLISAVLFLIASLDPPQPALTVLSVSGLSIFASALIASIPWLLGWHSIKVTETGISAQECGLLSIGCNLRTMEWSEARLFAIYPTRNPIDPPTYYELAGKTAIVRWRRIHAGDALHLTKILTSFDEYDRQMEALLALIAARTGLPLYNLRMPLTGTNQNTTRG